MNANELIAKAKQDLTCMHATTCIHTKNQVTCGKPATRAFRFPFGRIKWYLACPDHSEGSWCDNGWEEVPLGEFVTWEIHEL